MARLTGSYVDFKIGSTTVVGGHQWSIDHTADILDGTGFDTAAGATATKPNPITQWTATIAGHWDDTESNLYGAPAEFAAGQTLTTMKFYIDATKYFTGNGIISKFSATGNRAPGGEVDWNIEVRGDGTLTYPTT